MPEKSDIIGFAISAVGNDRYMFKGASQPPRCSGCQRILDPTWIDPKFTLRAGRRYDASYTYDSCLIVSDNFRVAAREAEGVTYLRLPQEPGFYRLDISRAAQLSFDTARRHTTFTEYCETCESFTQVAGATPAFLIDPPTPLFDHFMRTDIEFGSYDELGPLPLIGPGLAEKLRKANLTGLEFHAISS